MAYTWVPPSMFPGLVPWLALLGLLLLPRNRSLRAWAIWLPLVCCLCLTLAVRSALGFLPSQPADGFSETFRTLAFGLAALWLVSGYLQGKHRLLTSLASAATLTGFGLLTLIGGITEWALTGILGGICVLVISISLGLAGLLCRRKYSPSKLCLWLAICLPAVSLLVVSPFFIMALVDSRGNVQLTEFLQAIGILAGVSFAVVLPYLLLSFISGFYRERLKGFLKLGSQEAPPVIPAEPPQLTAEVPSQI